MTIKTTRDNGRCFYRETIMTTEYCFLSFVEFCQSCSAFHVTLYLIRRMGDDILQNLSQQFYSSKNTEKSMQHQLYFRNIACYNLNKLQQSKFKEERCCFFLSQPFLPGSNSFLNALVPLFLFCFLNDSSRLLLGSSSLTKLYNAKK